MKINILTVSANSSLIENNLVKSLNGINEINVLIKCSCFKKITCFTD